LKRENPTLINYSLLSSCILQVAIDDLAPCDIDAMENAIHIAFVGSEDVAEAAFDASTWYVSIIIFK
jgi:hypothetical protein